MVIETEPQFVNLKLRNAIIGMTGDVALKIKELGQILNRKALTISLVTILGASLLGCGGSVPSDPVLATQEAVIAYYNDEVDEYRQTTDTEGLLTEIIANNPYIANTSALIEFMPAENKLGGGYCSGGIFKIGDSNYVLTATHCMSQAIISDIQLIRPHLPNAITISAVIERRKDLPDLDITILRVITNGIDFDPYEANVQNRSPWTNNELVKGILFPGQETIPIVGNITPINDQSNQEIITNIRNAYLLDTSFLSEGASGGLLHATDGDIYMAAAVGNPDYVEGIILAVVPDLTDPNNLP